MSPLNKEGHYSDPSRYAAAPEEPEKDLTAEYVSNLAPIQKQRQHSKRIRIILLIVVVLAAIGGGVFWFLSRDKSQPVQQPAQTQQTPQASQTEVPVKEYESSAFGLSFSHPETWQVDDSKTGLLTLTSPVGGIKDESGTEVQGRVVLTFQTGVDKVPGYGTTNPVAALKSQKLTYAKPSQSQRKQTYLSFVNFNGTDGIDSIYVTGDAGYQQGQAVPQVDVKKVDPTIRIVAEKCEGEVCGGDAGTISMQASEWQSNPLLVQAEKLLTSLRVE